MCPMGIMQLMLVEGKGSEGQEEEGGEEGVRSKGEEREQEGGLEVRNMKISLKSLAGLTSNKSFKVEGEIGGRRVLVLVDSGALGNFLATRVAKELNLKVKKIPSFTIEVGTGQKEKGEGVCCRVELKVQGVNVIQNFFVMELGGMEVVLGMDWLSSLEKIEADFQEMTPQ